MLYNCLLLTGQAEAVAVRSRDGSCLVIVDQQVVQVDRPALHSSRRLVALAAGATIARPGLWRWFAAGSVEAYALSAPAWRRIVRGPAS
ncbi:hypothetical protein ABZW11_24395 [Nonomuraea sp. NPDC004580]|uniref:hypothetical protein n=1 Tax=Nonomuraea sp. NPDC004580 TaxID=3154552 RepID=UPI0033BECC40